MEAMQQESDVSFGLWYIIHKSASEKTYYNNGRNVLMKEIMPELNFVDEFELSRNGKIDELKIEFDTIRMCLDEMKNYGDTYRKMFERIIIVSLRKLLCENKNPILLDICPNFKMIPLKGYDVELKDGMHIIRPPLAFSPVSEWVPLNIWRKQKVAYYSRTASDFCGWMTPITYNSISNLLKGDSKKQFKEMMESQYVSICESICAGYGIKDMSDKEEVYQLMESVGYNELTIYRFIKHLADKQGAHLDEALSILIPTINQPSTKGFSLMQCIALQMIVACKQQIPELRTYWPEMPDVISEN